MAWVAAVVCGILLVASCAHTAPSYYASQLSKHRPLGPANHTRPLPGAGTYGVDVSTLVSESDFTCLKANGFEFAIVRGFQSNGVPDSNAPTTIANARAAGIPYVDAYLFPCPRCSSSAATQVASMVDKLSGSNYGMIWLDIEGSQYWLGSYSENQKFFEELLSAAASHKSTGVYASESQWVEIMGSSSYTGGAAHPLWYPHYDDNPSFSDFAPFGGWKTPNIKQYSDTATVCGVGIDRNWY
ncbi:hypothetical protein EMCRGX_G024031 [Ephydatia muelleri]|eukprot:Em0015g261a